MPTFKNSTRGFTLIELLVVITIIGILATLGVSQFTAQLQKTRDSKRISDMEKIKWALESYNLDNTQFPAKTDMSTFTGAIHSYLAVIPFDPKTAATSQTCAKKNNAAATKCEYAYDVGVDANDIVNNAFELSTGFESLTNIDVLAANAKDKGNCPDRLEIGTAYSPEVGWKAWQNLDANCEGTTTTGLFIK